MILSFMLLYKEPSNFELFSICPYSVPNDTKETCCNPLGLFCSIANKKLHILFLSNKAVSKD